MASSLIARLSLLSAIAVCVPAMASTVHAQTGVAKNAIVLTPFKSLSLGALKQFELKAGNALAPVTAMLEADARPTSTVIRPGDTLEGILRDQWGLIPGRDYSDLTKLTAQVLALPENAPIAARSKDRLDIRPGDRLYLPGVVFGHGKAVVVVPVAAAVDATKLAQETFAQGPQVASQQITPDTRESIATLSNVATCSNAESVAPFDAERLARRMKEIAVRQPKPGTPGGAIAVLDAGLRGKVGTLAPFFDKASSADPYRSEGGAYVAQSPPSGRTLDLLSKTDPPSDHGTHIMTLVLGGIDILDKLDVSDPASRPWRLIPVIVEGVRSLSNGSLVADMQPYWITNGVNYLRQRQARLVNMSLESQDAEYLAAAMLSATEVVSRLYVVASGNGQLFVDTQDDPPKKIKAIDFDYIQGLSYPMRIQPGMLGGDQRSHIISVAAHDKNNQLTAFSGRYRENVDIMAPGVCIKSYSTLGETLASSTPEGITGTSQAAAIVSYGASLVSDVLGANWSPGAVKARLLASSIYDKAYRDALSSSGRLSIEGAVAARFDLIRYRKCKDCDVIEAIGEFGDSGKRFRDVFMCDVEQIKIDNVWKAVPYMTGDKPTDARWDYVRRFPLSPGPADENQFKWRWRTCTANFGNVNKIRFTTVGGDVLDIDFANIAEVVPKHPF